MGCSMARLLVGVGCPALGTLQELGADPLEVFDLQLPD
jgi:hypothetical protein